jgi:hypothetical protein
MDYLVVSWLRESNERVEFVSDCYLRFVTLFQQRMSALSVSPFLPPNVPVEKNQP